MRKMAKVVKIDQVHEHTNADSLQINHIGGWRVISRIGEFSQGDMAVYCEIDSWIPHDLAPFLSKGSKEKTYNGVVGNRLRTIRLRGELSQGLLLPLVFDDCAEGDDVSERLGIQKWEPPIPAQLQGVMKGNFPGFIPKTDQERCQNLVEEIAQWHEQGMLFEVTEKLDGSSMTVYINGDDYGVCSRNVDLMESEDNTFWKVAREERLLSRMTFLDDFANLAIQGELIGEGIQGNPYKIKGQTFMLFDVYDIDRGEYMTPTERMAFAHETGIAHVPVLARGKDLGTGTIEDLLEWAICKSALNSNTEGEGIVFKAEDRRVSFKAISNRFLEKSKG